MCRLHIGPNIFEIGWVQKMWPFKRAKQRQISGFVKKVKKIAFNVFQYVLYKDQDYDLARFQQRLLSMYMWEVTSNTHVENTSRTV
jgi:hypothetical protein